MDNRICLNMIVRDEASNVDRVLASVKDIIEYYVIVDTGSTDDTIARIKTKMVEYGIPGVVLEDEWVNFGVNRTKALQHVYELDWDGWVLFIDADEEIRAHDFDINSLEKGVSYTVDRCVGGLTYDAYCLFYVTDKIWHWEGAVHEYIASDTQFRIEHLKTINILSHSGEGYRSVGKTQTEKFMADAILLLAEYNKDPTNTRTIFYLAQSFRDAGSLEVALDFYLKRTNMGGWDQEISMAWLQAGRIASALGKSDTMVEHYYLQSHVVCGIRAEPLYELAKHYRLKDKWTLAYHYAKQASDIPFLNQGLFIEHGVYVWRALDELSIAAYYMGFYNEAALIGKRITSLIDILTDAPEYVNEYPRLIANLGFAESACMT